MPTFFSSSDNFVYFLLFHRVFIYSPYKYLDLYYKYLLQFWFVLSSFHSLWIHVYHVLLRSLVWFKKYLSLFFFFFCPKLIKIFFICLVQFSFSVVSDSLWPHESQHARPPCPSPLPEFTQTHLQSIRATASASVLPMNTQDWSPLGWTGWISLQSKGLSRVLSNTTVQKHQLFGAKLSSQSNSHIHTWPLEKP